MGRSIECWNIESDATLIEAISVINEYGYLTKTKLGLGIYFGDGETVMIPLPSKIEVKTGNGWIQTWIVTGRHGPRPLTAGIQLREGMSVRIPK